MRQSYTLYDAAGHLPPLYPAGTGAAISKRGNAVLKSRRVHSHSGNRFYFQSDALGYFDDLPNNTYALTLDLLPAATANWTAPVP